MNKAGCFDRADCVFVIAGFGSYLFAMQQIRYSVFCSAAESWSVKSLSAIARSSFVRLLNRPSKQVALDIKTEEANVFG
jgi:hypothetical protein